MQKVNRKLLGFTLMERVDESLVSYLDKNPKPSTAVLHSISDQFVNLLGCTEKPPDFITEYKKNSRIILSSALQSSNILFVNKFQGLLITPGGLEG
jgi:hypothetical protein